VDGKPTHLGGCYAEDADTDGPAARPTKKTRDALGLPGEDCLGSDLEVTQAASVHFAGRESMGMIKLSVPVLAQEKSMCCWHTSALMIWTYWQQHTRRHGPMNTLSPVYEANTVLSPQAFITLAKKTGLMPLPSQNTYTNMDLYRMLYDLGPLWCAGYWYGFGHVIVLTGTEAGWVYLNDPDGGQRKMGTLAWFNEKLSKGLNGCIMAKHRAAY
jgi:hypothetical protein